MNQLKIEDMVNLYEQTKGQDMSKILSKEELKKHNVYLDKKVNGIIASKDFSQGDTIKEVNAYGIADLETMMQFEKKYENKNEDMDPAAQRLLHDAIQIDKGKYLVSKSDFEFSIRHSCDPNAAFIQYNDGHETKYAFVVLKPIKKGEEIRFDYSTVIGDEYILECPGDEKDCRGFAGRPAIHSKKERKKILKKYPKGWLLPYIEKELKEPFPGKELQYLDEPYAETTIYSFDGLKKRKTFDAKMNNMQALIEKCPNFHPKFKDMMMEYIESED